MRPDDFNILAHATTVLFPREATKAMTELSQDEERPIEKAHVSGYNRTVKGKTVHVRGYDNSKAAVEASARTKPKDAGSLSIIPEKGTPRFMHITTHDASELAHDASEYAAAARTREAHAAAVQFHNRAADDHERAMFNRNGGLVSDHHHHLQASEHHRKAAEYHGNMAIHGKPSIAGHEHEEWEGYPDEKKIKEHLRATKTRFMDAKESQGKS